MVWGAQTPHDPLLARTTSERERLSSQLTATATAAAAAARHGTATAYDELRTLASHHITPHHTLHTASQHTAGAARLLQQHACSRTAHTTTYTDNRLQLHSATTSAYGRSLPTTASHSSHFRPWCDPLSADLHVAFLTSTCWARGHDGTLIEAAVSPLCFFLPVALATLRRLSQPVQPSFTLRSSLVHPSLPPSFPSLFFPSVCV